MLNRGLGTRSALWDREVFWIVFPGVGKFLNFFFCKLAFTFLAVYREMIVPHNEVTQLKSFLSCWDKCSLMLQVRFVLSAFVSCHITLYIATSLFTIQMATVHPMLTCAKLGVMFTQWHRYCLYICAGFHHRSQFNDIVQGFLLLRLDLVPFISIAPMCCVLGPFYRLHRTLLWRYVLLYSSTYRSYSKKGVDAFEEQTGEESGRHLCDLSLAEWILLATLPIANWS